jgi:hypothetical protein
MDDQKVQVNKGRIGDTGKLTSDITEPLFGLSTYICGTELAWLDTTSASRYPQKFTIICCWSNRIRRHGYPFSRRNAPAPPLFSVQSNIIISSPPARETTNSPPRVAFDPSQLGH